MYASGTCIYANALYRLVIELFFFMQTRFPIRKSHVVSHLFMSFYTKPLHIYKVFLTCSLQNEKITSCKNVIKQILGYLYFVECFKCVSVIRISNFYHIWIITQCSTDNHRPLSSLSHWFQKSFWNFCKKKKVWYL